MYAYYSFFHQGYASLNDIEPYLKNLNSVVSSSTSISIFPAFNFSKKNSKENRTLKMAALKRGRVKSGSDCITFFFLWVWVVNLEIPNP